MDKYMDKTMIAIIISGLMLLSGVGIISNQMIALKELMQKGQNSLVVSIKVKDEQGAEKVIAAPLVEAVAALLANQQQTFTELQNAIEEVRVVNRNVIGTSTNPPEVKK